MKEGEGRGREVKEGEGRGREVKEGEGRGRREVKEGRERHGDTGRRQG